MPQPDLSAQAVLTCKCLPAPWALTALPSHLPGQSPGSPTTHLPSKSTPHPSRPSGPGISDLIEHQHIISRFSNLPPPSCPLGMPSSRKPPMKSAPMSLCCLPHALTPGRGGLSGAEGWFQGWDWALSLRWGQVQGTAGPSGPAAVRGRSLGSPGFPWTGSHKGQRSKVGGGRALSTAWGHLQPSLRRGGASLQNWPWGPCRLRRLGPGGVCLTPTCNLPQRPASPGVRPGGLGRRWTSAGRAPGPCQATSSRHTQHRTNLSPGIFPHKTRLPGKQPV